jgi:hypothetical protein
VSEEDERRAGAGVDGRLGAAFSLRSLVGVLRKRKSSFADGFVSDASGI